MVEVHLVNVEVPAGGVGVGQLEISGSNPPFLWSLEEGADWIEIEESGKVMARPPADVPAGIYPATVSATANGQPVVRYATAVSVTVVPSAAPVEPTEADADPYAPPVPVRPFPNDDAPEADDDTPPETEVPGSVVAREPLEVINGIGPVTADRLRASGVADIGALAALNAAQCEQMDVREEWRDDAKILLTREAADRAAEADAAGGRAGE